MKARIIEDLTKLKEASGSSKYLSKKYDSWIKALNEDLELSVDFKKFLYSKSSFTQNSDPEYSKYLYLLAEK